MRKYISSYINLYTLLQAIYSICVYCNVHVSMGALVHFHTCQPCHFILLDTFFTFAGHQEKLQDTNTTYMYTQK